MELGDVLGYKFKAASINTARAIYSMNWFDITPGLTYIAADLRLKIVELGIITTSFYVGLALFQMVGGILASRMGPKIVAFLGIMILGISSTLSGLSNNLFELTAFRFIAGIGSALFFSPGLSVLKNISPPESFGFQVGIYNGAFSLGGGIGALGWVFVINLVGWRLSLVLGGLLAVGIALENAIVLRDEAEEKVALYGLGKRLSGIVKNKYLWLLSIGTIVVIFSETIIGQFIIYFSVKKLFFTTLQGGIIDGIFLMIGFAGGIIGGHIISMTNKRRTFTFFVLGVDGVLFMLIPFVTNFIGLVIVIAILGLIVVSGFSVLYTITAEIIEDKSMISFSLSFVNFIQLVLGSLSPILFAEIAYHASYTYSWLLLGAAGLIMVPILTLVKTNSFK